MEGIFPRNAHLKIIIGASSTRTICKVALIGNNENQLDDAKSGYSSEIISKLSHGTFRVNSSNSPFSINSSAEQDIRSIFAFISVKSIAFSINTFARYISMLKRSLSMEFDSDHFKASSQQPPPPPPPPPQQDAAEGDGNQSNKKMCHSPERSGYEDADQSADSRWSKNRKLESYGRYGQSSADNPHVTQSKSIFSHENSCIYGNPKEDIKSIENPEAMKEISHFDSTINALDLTCKKPEEDKSEGNTYQNYHKSGSENPFNRANLQVKLISPTHKKPSIPEQLQIAKLQQQQRRSIQQQQKLIQQMRRSLDPAGKTSNRSHNSEKKQYQGSNAVPGQEGVDLDFQNRMKEEFSGVGTHPPPYSYFETGQHKELPDGHPILPLLDPVYFSALYNAHGFLPPSSPSIAAAFIGTLQDALPKLPLMFPSTSTSNSPILPQKSNDNHN